MDKEGTENRQPELGDSDRLVQFSLNIPHIYIYIICNIIYEDNILYII